MLMEVHAMIKLDISFVNVLLVMKEQTVKMVSKNNGQKLTFYVLIQCEISANKLSNIYNIVTIFTLACKIVSSLFTGLRYYFTNRFGRQC